MPRPLHLKVAGKIKRLALSFRDMQRVPDVPIHPTSATATDGRRGVLEGAR